MIQCSVFVEWHVKEEGRKVKSVLEYFEQTAERCKDKTAVDDGEVCYSWSELMELSKRIGSALAEENGYGKPIPIVMDKSADTLAAFLGVVYAGAFYVLVNPEYPNVRIEKILKTLVADMM